MTDTKLHDCFRYEDADIPPGLSMATWRARRPRVRTRRHVLLHLLLLGRF